MSSENEGNSLYSNISLFTRNIATGERMFDTIKHRNVNTGYDHDSNQNANPMVRFSASPACAQTSTPDVVTNISGETR